MKHRGGKSVTFSDTSSLFLVADLASGPLKPRLWFAPSELDSFEVNARVDTHAVRQLIRSRRTPGASDILGMEKFLTDELTREYTARQRKRTHAVLDEADFQRLACARDPHGGNPLSRKNVARLAAVAAEESRWARERARAAALFLELDQDQENEREQQLDQQPQVEGGLKLKNDERRRLCLEWQSQAEEILELRWQLEQQRQAEESLERQNDIRSQAQEEVLELRWQLEQQLQAEESLKLKKAEESLKRHQAPGTHRSPVDSVPSVERGHRSSLQETVRTRSRIVSTSVVDVSPSLMEGGSQTSVWL